MGRPAGGVVFKGLQLEDVHADSPVKCVPHPEHTVWGYKDGLQPESLADGNWLVKQKQPVSKIETKSDTKLVSASHK